MGYSIDQLKKTGTLEGNDTIPVMQGGLTKQVAAGILDNAKIITAAGSQASGIIRRETTYILKNNSSAINFTLNNAVGKKVVNNDYSDDAATATGWIVKVMNVSTRSHVVIVGSNSWDIAKNETMYFYWTGSAWTLHNARMNNVIVDGDLQLPNAAAVTSLQATSKLTGLDANGKVKYTTPDAIKNTLGLATTTDLANYPSNLNLDGAEHLYSGDMNDCPYGIYRIPNTNTNLPVAKNGYVHTYIRTTNNRHQIFYTDDKNMYIRNKTTSWSAWEKLTSETDVNNALANYQNIKKISFQNYNGVNMVVGLADITDWWNGTGIGGTVGFNGHIFGSRNAVGGVYSCNCNIVALVNDKKGTATYQSLLVNNLGIVTCVPCIFTNEGRQYLGFKHRGNRDYLELAGDFKGLLDTFVITQESNVIIEVTA